MKHVIILLFLFSTALDAQDSLNCNLLTKTDKEFWALNITVQNNYLFTTSPSTFSIIDISDIYNPILVYSDSLAREIWRVFVKNNLVFLAADLEGLIILDITNIESPQLVSKLNLNASIVEVVVKQNIAYLGAWGSAIILVDISDPENPVELSRIDKNIDYNIDDVWDIAVNGDLLFAATENTGLKIFDISDPYNLIELLTNIGHYEAETVAVKDSIVYVGTAGILAYNISNIEEPKSIFLLEGVYASDIFIEGNLAYCAFWNQLTVLDISNPTSLNVVGKYPLNAQPMSLYVLDKMAIIPQPGHGIYFVQYDETTNVNEISLNDSFILSQNFPNPFNPATTIEYQIPEHIQNNKSLIPSGVEGSLIELVVYDILGREVATLLNEKQKPGSYKIMFDGSSLSSGIYYYQLKTNDFVQVNKMILLK
jgi:hypothetical protein